MADAYFGHINILSMQMVGIDYIGMEPTCPSSGYTGRLHIVLVAMPHTAILTSSVRVLWHHHPYIPYIFGKEQFYTCSICNRNRHPEHGGDCMFSHVHVWGTLEGHTGIVYIMFLKSWGARLSSKKKKGNAG